MHHFDAPGILGSDRELLTLIVALASHRRGLTSLQLARETGLSTIVVVPTLTGLVSQGLAVRSEFGVRGATNRNWTYRLTMRGREVLARSMGSVPH